jgi:hypothetical protein
MEGVTPVARLSLLSLISVFLVLLAVPAATGAVPCLCAVINYHTGTTVFLQRPNFLYLRPHPWWEPFVFLISCFIPFPLSEI